MLQFNLSKPDRIAVHKRIASGQISAREISSMSSADLANEETKQSIKLAEQEALKHSILQKTTAPRAKITHKGFEDIEDINGSNAGVPDREEREREARIERERLDRLKAAQASRQRTMSLSVPPESPLSLQSMDWTAQSSLPMHPFAEEHHGMLVDEPTHSFSPTILEASSEPELDLAELINIDDEPGVQETVESVQGPLQASASQSPTTERSALPPITTAGIFPFATNTPVESAKPSFDLNSLWSASSTDAAHEAAQASNAFNAKSPDQHSVDGEPKDIVMESAGSAHEDQDFDMFFDDKTQGPSPDTLQTAFNGSKVVWNGKVGE
jgi:hypothetical protein